MIDAPAKLNLYLHLTGNRADGYHTLESLVAFTELADRLTFAQADMLSLQVSGEFAEGAGQADNLVLRAATLLQQESGTSQGAAITLEKNIPVGAGLGGGSADAAATLRALNDLWKLGLGDDALVPLGLKLGADVPMCLLSRPLVARGIGEKIAALESPLPPLSVVLVYPRATLLTAQVFAMVDSRHSEERSDVAIQTGSPRFARDDVGQWLRKHTRNDLQRPAIAALPVVAEVLLAMETAPPKPGLVRMTGSGACCFALFGDADRAGAYAAQLSARYPAWWIRVTTIRA